MKDFILLYIKFSKILLKFGIIGMNQYLLASVLLSALRIGITSTIFGLFGYTNFVPLINYTNFVPLQIG